MSTVAIEDILQRIATLPEEERALLEERLSGLVEADWQKMAIEARREGQRRGLNQAAIDQAVRELRQS